MLDVNCSSGVSSGPFEAVAILVRHQSTIYTGLLVYTLLPEQL